MRKRGFVAGGFPHRAEAGVPMDGALRGRWRLFFTDATFPAEGVAEAPQGLERGGDFPRPAFHSSKLMKR
ncbi:MAG: hypothetical protein K2K67_07845 [Treponemataceae bacterium]|nr:hypothetical protein [Treponemataceae bacterium]